MHVAVLEARSLPLVAVVRGGGGGTGRGGSWSCAGGFGNLDDIHTATVVAPGRMSSRHSSLLRCSRLAPRRGESVVIVIVEANGSCAHTRLLRALGPRFSTRLAVCSTAGIHECTSCAWPLARRCSSAGGFIDARLCSSDRSNHRAVGADDSSIVARTLGCFARLQHCSRRGFQVVASAAAAQHGEASPLNRVQVLHLGARCRRHPGMQYFRKCQCVTATPHHNRNAPQRHEPRPQTNGHTHKSRRTTPLSPVSRGGPAGCRHGSAPPTRTGPTEPNYTAACMWGSAATTAWPPPPISPHRNTHLIHTPYTTRPSALGRQRRLVSPHPQCTSSVHLLSAHPHQPEDGHQRADESTRHRHRRHRRRHPPPRRRLLSLSSTLPMPPPAHIWSRSLPPRQHQTDDNDLTAVSNRQWRAHGRRSRAAADGVPRMRAS